LPARESLVSGTPPGDGKIVNLFYIVSNSLRFTGRLPLSPRTSIVKHRAACLAALYLLFLLGFDPDLFSLPEAIK
jgi:hypothetical protein